MHVLGVMITVLVTVSEHEPFTDIVHGVRSGMASVRLQPPSSFDFETPDEWPRWKRRFEQFRLASGLSADDDRQVSTLLYCMGEEAEDTLTSTNISAADRKKYDAVIGQFDRFFRVRKNVIFERAIFNRRCQGQNETAEQFITSLYSLGENCEYRELKDQMIRDRIVVGIRDQSQSARLQMDPELTLEKAKTLVRQREAVQKQQSLLQHGPKVDKVIDSLHKTLPFKGKGSHRGRRPPTTARQPQLAQGKCSRCGHGPHSRQQCPARDAECHTCHKKGHYSAQCFHKSVADVADHYDRAYLNTIGADQATMWNCTIRVVTSAFQGGHRRRSDGDLRRTVDIPAFEPAQASHQETAWT